MENYFSDKHYKFRTTTVPVIDTLLNDLKIATINNILLPSNQIVLTSEIHVTSQILCSKK